jgi:hypothetical protein
MCISEGNTSLTIRRARRSRSPRKISGSQLSICQRNDFRVNSRYFERLELVRCGFPFESCLNKVHDLQHVSRTSVVLKPWPGSALRRVRIATVFWRIADIAPHSATAVACPRNTHATVQSTRKHSRLHETFILVCMHSRFMMTRPCFAVAFQPFGKMH